MRTPISPLGLVITQREKDTLLKQDNFFKQSRLPLQHNKEKIGVQIETTILPSTVVSFQQRKGGRWKLDGCNSYNARPCKCGRWQMRPTTCFSDLKLTRTHGSGSWSRGSSEDRDSGVSVGGSSLPLRKVKKIDVTTFAPTWTCSYSLLLKCSAPALKRCLVLKLAMSHGLDNVEYFKLKLN